jgi:hypothetical protein
VGKSCGAIRVIQHRALRALRLLLDEPEFRAISARMGVDEMANDPAELPKLRIATHLSES